MDAGKALRVTAADGRTLAGASFGPESGQPVLFIAGAATSKQMSFGLDVLNGRGIRLLTMDRAGLGDSTPAPQRDLASTAADYRSFLTDVLDKESPKIPVVANSQGSVFGLKLAAYGAVSSLSLVSPADEIAHPAIHAMLPAVATALTDLACSAPEKATEILRGFSAEKMEEMVLASSAPADAAFYRAPSFRAVYRRALDEGFANDGAGYIQDTLMALLPWDIELSTISCPVHILFGVEDLSHSPDHGETLAARIPGAVRIVVEDAGGSLLWTHAPLVFDTALMPHRKEDPCQ